MFDVLFKMMTIAMITSTYYLLSICVYLYIPRIPLLVVEVDDEVDTSCFMAL